MKSLGLVDCKVRVPRAQSEHACSRPATVRKERRAVQSSPVGPCSSAKKQQGGATVQAVQYSEACRVQCSAVPYSNNCTHESADMSNTTRLSGAKVETVHIDSTSWKNTTNILGRFVLFYYNKTGTVSTDSTLV